MLAGGRPDQVDARASEAERAGVGLGASCLRRRSGRPRRFPLFLDAADVLVSPRSTRHEHAAEDLPVPPLGPADRRDAAADAHAGARRRDGDPDGGDARGLRRRASWRRSPIRERAPRRRRSRARQLAETKYSYEAYLDADARGLRAPRCARRRRKSREASRERRAADAADHYSYAVYADPAMAESLRRDAVRRADRPAARRIAGARDRGVPRRRSTGGRFSTWAPAPGARRSRWRGAGARVTGVDASAEMLRRRASGARRTPALAVDVRRAATRTRSRSPIASFDAVVCLRVLMHTPDWRQCARRAVPRRARARRVRLSGARQRRGAPGGRRGAWRMRSARASRRTACSPTARSRDALAAHGFRIVERPPAVRAADRACTRRWAPRRSPSGSRARSRASGCCGSLGSPVTLVAERCASSSPARPGSRADIWRARSRRRGDDGARARARRQRGAGDLGGRRHRRCDRVTCATRRRSRRGRRGVDVVYHIAAIYRQAGLRGRRLPRRQRRRRCGPSSRPAAAAACGASCTAAPSACTATSSIRRPTKMRRSGRATSIRSRSSKGSARARGGEGDRRRSGHRAADRHLRARRSAAAQAVPRRGAPAVRRSSAAARSSITSPTSTISSRASGCAATVPAAAGRTYILAGGEVTTLNELVALIAEEAGVRAADAAPAGVAVLGSPARSCEARLRAVRDRAAALSPPRRLLHEEPRVRHHARPRGAGVRAGGRPARRHSHDARLVSARGVVMNVARLARSHSSA